MVIAAVSAFAGAMVSFLKNWPLGASQVAAAVAVLILSRLAWAAVGAVKRRWAAEPVS